MDPNVAAIICEIRRYWAILEKIFKIHGDIRRYWAILGILGDIRRYWAILGNIQGLETVVSVLFTNIRMS